MAQESSGVAFRWFGARKRTDRMPITYNIYRGAKGAEKTHRWTAWPKGSSGVIYNNNKHIQGRMPKIKITK
jgi:hypothetical protein